jgi:hypothetical protein
MLLRNVNCNALCCYALYIMCAFTVHATRYACCVRAMHATSVHALCLALCPMFGPMPYVYATSVHATSAHATSVHTTSVHTISAHATSAHATSVHTTSAHATSAHATSVHAIECPCTVHALCLLLCMLCG